MPTNTDCAFALKRLMQVFPLQGWNVTIQIRKLDVADDEEYVSARTDYDDALRRAVISIDANYPNSKEIFTLRELIAHELGHIVLTETTDTEYASTMIGQLISTIADLTP